MDITILSFFQKFKLNQQQLPARDMSSLSHNRKTTGLVHLSFEDIFPANQCTFLFKCRPAYFKQFIMWIVLAQSESLKLASHYHCHSVYFSLCTEPQHDQPKEYDVRATTTTLCNPQMKENPECFSFLKQQFLSSSINIISTVKWKYPQERYISGLLDLE